MAWISAEDRNARRAFALFAGVAGLFILIVQAHAPLAVMPNGGFDDGLYIHVARSLAFGSWFGPYNFVAIHKGNGYSFFLALSSWLQISTTLAHAAFHAAACVAFAWAIARVSASRLLGACVLLVLALLPVLGTAPLLRVARDAIYSGQTLLVLASVLLLLHRQDEPDRWKRGIGAGALFAWMWLTREEGAWILPALALLFLGLPLADGRTVRGGAGRMGAYAGTCLTLAWFALGFAAVDGSYRLINRLVYGTWTDVAIKDPSFEAALGALYAVEDADQIPYVPVSRTTRARIYAESPAFAALQPYLDPPGAPIWTYGCAHYPTSCGDMAGGWFHVAFLSAVAEAGHHRTQEEAKAYYRRIAQEVTDACDDGRLRCRPTLAPRIPRLAPDLEQTLPRRVLAILHRVTMATPLPVHAHPSTGTTAELGRALAFLNQPPHVPLADVPTSVVIEGRYQVPDGASFEIRLLDEAGAVVPSTFTRLAPSEADAGTQEAVFRMAASCPLPACRLQARQDETQVVLIRLWDLTAANTRFRWPGGHVRILSLSTDGGGNLIGDVRLRGSRIIRSALVAMDAYVLPPLAAVGAAALLAGLILAPFGRRLPVTLLIAAALTASATARIALFVVADAAGLPTSDAYIAPSTFLYAVAAPLAIHGVLSALRNLRNRPPKPAAEGSGTA